MISCSEYDYIEIVCMHSYPIKLTLKQNKVIEGIALDTQLNTCREECIKISINNIDTLVKLTDILKLEICVNNPHFKEVVFA